MVWVQWEIGSCIKGDTTSPSDLDVLEPKPNIEKDIVNYVSTRDVIEKISRHLEKNSRILVVAHPVHICRCIKTLRQYDYKDVVAVQHTRHMDPSWYDKESGQLWTKTSHLHLLHEMLGCLSLHRQAMNKKAKEKGIWK